MTDPPGVPSALGIESVEWAAQDDQITIRVGGRWRRRRPSLGGQPMLVLEAHGMRHRFPAMPEPPSLSGASPGTWWLSFSVPASLAPELGGRLWLQFGAVVVPLPAPVQRPAARDPAPPADPSSLGSEMLVQRQLRGSELALQDARRRAAEAEHAGRELSARIGELEDRAAHLSALLAEHAAARRVAEQRAYADQALRVEFEEHLAAIERDGSSNAEMLQRRIAELESELESLRRRLDEAEHLAAAAAAARLRAELVASAHRPAGRAVPDLGAEFAAAGLSTVVGPQALRRRSPPASDQALLRSERTLVRLWGGDARAGRLDLAPTVAALRAELDARRTAEAQVHALLGMVEARVQTRARAEDLLRSTLSELRAELDLLRSLAEREHAARAEAEARAASLERRLRQELNRSARAYQAIGSVRAELDAVRVAREHERRPAPDPSGPVESERLAAALERLRDGVPPGDPDSDPGEPGSEPGEREPGSQEGEPASLAPPAPRRAWLPRVFKSLVENEPMTAGRLLLQLLPAQRESQAQPLAYDLILGEGAVVQVTVAGGPARVDFADSARAVGEVRFQVTGDLPTIARTLAASRFRRRLGRGMAHVAGDRRAFVALADLVRSPLTLYELHAAGVRLDPPLALTVAALMVDPGATRGQRFTIAHQATESSMASAFLHVADRRLSVTETPPPTPAGTTIVSEPDALLLVLAGVPDVDAFVIGERGPVELLQRWLQEAQTS